MEGQSNQDQDSANCSSVSAAYQELESAEGFTENQASWRQPHGSFNLGENGDDSIDGSTHQVDKCMANFTLPSLLEETDDATDEQSLRLSALQVSSNLPKWSQETDHDDTGVSMTRDDVPMFPPEFVPARAEPSARYDEYGQRIFEPWSRTSTMEKFATPGRRQSTYTSNDNIDKRNVDTFGDDAVQLFNSRPVQDEFPPSRHPRPQYQRQHAVEKPRVFHDMRMPQIQDRRTKELMDDVSRSGEAERHFFHRTKTNDFSQLGMDGSMRSSRMMIPHDDESLETKLEKIRDISDDLLDPDAKPNDVWRRSKLKQLLQIVTPAAVHEMSANIHSRKLLLHSLSLLSREPYFREEVIKILAEILSNLDRCLSDDRLDMVFASRTKPLTRIIANCTMVHVNQLTCSLLKSSEMAIASKMGLFLIGRLIDRADELDFEEDVYWRSVYVPDIKECLNRVDMKFLREFVGAKAIAHLTRIEAPQAMHGAYSPHLRADTSLY